MSIVVRSRIRTCVCFEVTNSDCFDEYSRCAILTNDGITLLGGAASLDSGSSSVVVPRKEVVDPVDWVIGDVGEHVA